MPPVVSRTCLYGDTVTLIDRAPSLTVSVPATVPVASVTVACVASATVLAVTVAPARPLAVNVVPDVHAVLTPTSVSVCPAVCGSSVVGEALKLGAALLHALYSERT